jgi:predicted molibdopterin-dependent oxidoreductase YjgC
MCEPGVPTLEYDAAGGPNRGSLCAKGNVSLELMTHPQRLESPRVREGDRRRAAGWDEALAWAGDRVAQIRSVHGGSSVGILLGPQLTDEEAAAAVRLAQVIGTPHVDLCEPEDHAVMRGVELSSARPTHVERVEQIDQMDALLVVGDLFTLAPCAAKPVLNARYRERRHTVAVLGPTKTRTAWFGRPALRCEPNGDAPALALLLALALDSPGAVAPVWATDARGMLSRWPAAELERRSGVSRQQAADLVRSLQNGRAAGVLVASQFGATARVDLVAGLAALLAEAVGARFLAMLEGANSFGIHSVLAAEGYPRRSGHTTPELLEAVVTRDVRALLVFGADPVAAFPGSIAAQAMHAASLTLVTAPLPGPAADVAHVLLPSAVFGEKSGTTRGAFGTPTTLTEAMAPPGQACADLAVLERLAAVIPSHAASAEPAGVDAAGPGFPFFAELDLFLRSEGRAASHEPGTHLLLAESSATNAAEGSITRQLSWARYTYPQPLLAIPATQAVLLGVRAGDRVRVRINWGEAELPVRIDPSLPEGVVTAPHRDPAVRGLLRWRRDPTLRSLDLRPERISLERVTEVAGA